jgi:hypothetical protein
LILAKQADILMKQRMLAAAATVFLAACNAPSQPDPDRHVSAAASDAPARVASSPLPSAPRVGTAMSPATATHSAAREPIAATEAMDGDAAVDRSIDKVLGDHARYRVVILALQKAVADGDAAAVAALVHYPISVNIEGKRVLVRNAKVFMARYGEFMTPRIRDAIVHTRYRDLFVNYKGVMFGRGQAWINGICRDKACAEFDVRVVTLQPGP